MIELSLAFDDDHDLPLLAEHQPVELSCAAPPGTQLVLEIGGQVAAPFLRPGESVWRWRWNPGPAVGVHQATLTAIWPDGHVARRTFALRVSTRKLDQERYEALLEDLQRTAYGLLYSLAGAGAEGAALQREPPWQHNPVEDYYALFEQRFEPFARAVQRIAARPREHLQSSEEQVPLGQAARIGAAALARLAQADFDTAPPDAAPELQAALRPDGGLLPRSVPVARGAPTTDIYEHRLLKRLLVVLRRRAQFIGTLAGREATRLAALEALTGVASTRRSRAEQIAAGCAQAAQRLRDLQSLPFLAEVRPLTAFRGATPLLQRDAAYREVYRMWLALRQHPYVAFDSPLFSIPIADLPHLYEGWCAIQVAQALLSLGGTLREQRLVEQTEMPDEADELEFSVNLVEDLPLLVVEHAGARLTLRYQPRYRPLRSAERRTMGADRSALHLGSLDRYTRIPDLAIEVQRPGEQPQVLVLDAKYRLDVEGRSVPPDALADAYTYLGAIGSAGTRATLGALLLYPGLGAPELYASGAGAVPLLPGHTDGLAKVLAEHLGLAA